MSSQKSSVILSDQNQWTAWIVSITSRAKSLKVWPKVKPGSNLPLLEEPTEPEVPSLSGHDSYAGIDEPIELRHLTANGLKTYEKEMAHYRTRIESFKIKQHKYEQETKGLDILTTLIQSSIVTHLQESCCDPDESLQEWLQNLQKAVGIDSEVELEDARQRYLAALKPMRSPNQWVTWLAEYEKASLHAQAKGVPDFTHFEIIAKDFADAVNPFAKNWTPNFMDHGRKEPGMNIREMMKRYRDHMTQNHPLDSKRSRAGVFVTADDRSDPADGGASTKSRKRDASDPAASAPLPKRSKTEKTRQKKLAKSSNSEKKACPACNCYHKLANCFYLNKDQAPEGFRFNESLGTFIEYRKRSDPGFQKLLQESGFSTTKDESE
ncbi:hypothetical protein E4U33_000001 [Claviceps sp. LM78 group G4]|nr:hypothetical protein E4U33_000001 [Claviceps sp. LM78 group G4]